MSKVTLNRALRTTMTGIVAIENAYSKAVGAAAERRASAARGVMNTTMTALIAADHPKTDAGRKAFVKAWNEEWERNPTIPHLIAGGLSMSSWSAYRAGLFWAYCAGVEWTAQAHFKPEDGGVPRPEWWDGGNAKKKNPEDGKAGKTGKASTKDGGSESPVVDEMKALKEEAQHLAGRVATLLGNDGNAILAALKAAGLI